ncbi:hypothetical protein [Peribacillus sp. RS7]
MLGESLRTGSDDKRPAEGRARAKAQLYNKSPEKFHFDHYHSTVSEMNL